MSRTMFVVAFLLGAACMPLAAGAAPFTLKSESVNFPDSDKTFPGPGADEINNNCLSCHSAGMVLTQPALSKDAWAATVHKMITAYKAPIDPNDVDAIVAYLVREKGK
jgi:mono/diheme cytochrome c family protein